MSKRNIVLGLLFCGGLINYMDRAVFGVLAPLISKDLALSPSELGVVFSAFSAGYMVFAILGGWAVDRFGSQRVLLYSMTCWSTLCALTGAAVGFTSLICIRVLFGIAESPWVPGSSKAVAAWFGRKRFASAYGMQSSGQPLGGAITGPIAGFAAILFGWRGAFLFVAIIGLSWVAAWFSLGLHKTPEPVSDNEEVQLESAPPSEQLTSARRSWLDPTLLATGLAFSAQTYLLTFFLTWFPTYLTTEQHLDLRTMSLVSALPWALGTVGLFCSGLISDALARRASSPIAGRRLMLMVCLSGAALSVGFVPFVHSTVLAVMLMSVALGLGYSTGANYFAIILDTGRTSALGAISSAFVVAGNLAAVLSPATTGFLIQRFGNFDAAFLGVAGLLLSGSIAIGLFVRQPAE